MPFLVCRTTAETMYSGMLEANGAEVIEWLRSPSFESKLFSFFPCTDILPTSANKVGYIQAMSRPVVSESPVLIPVQVMILAYSSFKNLSF